MVTSVLRSFYWTCPVHLTPLNTDFSWIDCAIALVLEEWFESYLHNRKQYVMIDGVKSHVKDLQFGVSQGSVFRPILHSLNRNPYVIHDDISKCKTCIKTFLFKENFDYSSVRNIAKEFQFLILISILIFRYEFLTCAFKYLCFIIDVFF